MNKKNKFASVLTAIITVVLLAITVYPLFWMLTASFKEPSEFVTKPAYALNSGFYVQNYIDAWTRGNMSTFFKNSLINTLISLVFIVFFSVTLGFALTKMEWKYRKFVRGLIGIGIMVPITTALLPLFQIYNTIGLYNTRSSLVISYVAFGLSLSTYLTIAFFKSLPNELLEAAVIDGCGISKLMTMVVVPLMKNAIVTVLVLQFFFKWNDLLFSMTFISSTELKTIMTGLLYFQDEFGSKNWGAIFASISLSVFPLLIVYLFLNKAVIEGMTSGAIKG
ncbi:MAG: carbohydrate ABC transporter permease [Lachnospirales bacterium]